MPNKVIDGDGGTRVLKVRGVSSAPHGRRYTAKIQWIQECQSLNEKTIFIGE
ncbi:MAG: hypothetical protein GF313_08805 [Caldithrix sp.]|nr:hypothetical protein [Caldithrix sp.]